MQGIIDFLSLIGDTLVAVVQFFVSFIQDIVFVVQLAGQFLASIPQYFSWLPAPIAAMLVTSVVVIMIYKIAGRS